jgi:hypothetical protein
MSRDLKVVGQMGIYLPQRTQRWNLRLLIADCRMCQSKILNLQSQIFSVIFVVHYYFDGARKRKSGTGCRLLDGILLFRLG